MNFSLTFIFHIYFHVSIFVFSIVATVRLNVLPVFNSCDKLKFYFIKSSKILHYTCMFKMSWGRITIVVLWKYPPPPPIYVLVGEMLNFVCTCIHLFVIKIVSISVFVWTQFFFTFNMCRYLENLLRNIPYFTIMYVYPCYVGPTKIAN